MPQSRVCYTVALYAPGEFMSGFDHRFKVIAFDLDDTLWPCMPTINRAEQALYDWLAENFPRITEDLSLGDLTQFRIDLMAEQEHLQIDLSQLRRELLSRLAERFDYADTQLVEQGFELFYRLRHDVEFYEDVFPVLDNLRNHFRLGSISNGNASAGLTQLADYFDCWMNAADIMVRKPDQELFHTFCDKMGVKPEDCLYVGDDPFFDVVGSRNAGMHSLWLNREGQDWPDEHGVAPDEIRSLHDLAAWVLE